MKLTRWDHLAKNTLAEVEGQLDLLFDEKYKDPYLHYFLLSNMYTKQYWPNLDSFFSVLPASFRVFSLSSSLPTLLKSILHSHPTSSLTSYDRMNSPRNFHLSLPLYIPYEKSQDLPAIT
eukprot:TRINITY_DN30721_c0_g1_i1.p1 TRINITY_DN30721_c0_g1~~TRINITY_DN30721_c0_g1_i1.p1  ORF type:complete len:120 (-),score=14.16 TRINITY_DN30721_c0_g1_i1:273-632(-)